MAMDKSAEGVRDLAGSLQEWVFDRFVAPYPDCGACLDPVVDQGVATPMRVVRGADFRSPPGFIRAVERGRWTEDRSAKSLGFRCAAPSSP
jgi:formylglycine-generating enzyme required for sulfatase activity